MMRVVLLLIGVLAACDSSDTNSRDGFHPGGGGDGGVPVDDLSFDHDAFFVQDPPVMYCGLDGGNFTTPPVPGGTLECPDDKNLEGCPCTTIGQTAPCWPGKRANRNLGQCKDGMTTCTQGTEVQNTWGPCVGYVLPDPNATQGAAACQCFSQGFWNVADLIVCGSSNGTSYTGFSGPLPPDGGTMIDCSMMMAAGTPWSSDTLTVDCAGRFKLCYTVKAGDFMNPQSTDCVVSTVCTMGDYTQVNTAQDWPPVPSWTSNNSACVMAFFTTGGYGEMSVAGTSVTCDQIPDHVFQRVRYCGQNETGCQSGGGGPFGK